MERGIRETERVAPIRLFSVWWRATGLRWRGIRDDGSDLVAGHDGAALSDDTGGEEKSEIAAVGDVTAEEWDSDGAAPGSFCGARCKSTSGGLSSTTRLVRKRAKVGSIRQLLPGDSNGQSKRTISSLSWNASFFSGHRRWPARLRGQYGGVRVRLAGRRRSNREDANASNRGARF